MNCSGAIISLSLKGINCVVALVCVYKLCPCFLSPFYIVDQHSHLSRLMYWSVIIHCIVKLQCSAIPHCLYPVASYVYSSDHGKEKRDTSTFLLNNISLISIMRAVILLASYNDLMDKCHLNTIWDLSVYFLLLMYYWILLPSRL